MRPRWKKRALKNESSTGTSRVAATVTIRYGGGVVPFVSLRGCFAIREWGRFAVAPGGLLAEEGITTPSIEEKLARDTTRKKKWRLARGDIIVRRE